MADYSREQDIGKPKDVTPVEVQNFSSVIAALETATAAIEEAASELRKITLGTGLVTGVDLDKEEIDD